MAIKQLSMTKKQIEDFERVDKNDSNNTNKNKPDKTG